MLATTMLASLEGKSGIRFAAGPGIEPQHTAAYPVMRSQDGAKQ